MILLTCSYKEQEFIRIGYYVHNEYEEPLDANNECTEIVPDKIQRNILADKPRVTRFNIAWDGDKDKMKESEVNGGEETKENENDDQYDDDDNDDGIDQDSQDEGDDDESEEDADLVEDLADSELKDMLKQRDNKNEEEQMKMQEDEDIDMMAE